MEPQSEDSPFTVSVTFQNIQADQIVADAGGPKGMVQGKLEGNFEAAGKTGDPDALTGAGQIFLRDGQLQQYSLLVALGQVLQIEELTQLHLEQAQAKYHLSPGLVTIDELILRSPNIRLSAAGTVTFQPRRPIVKHDRFHEVQVWGTDKGGQHLYKNGWTFYIT